MFGIQFFLKGLVCINYIQTLYKWSSWVICRIYIIYYVRRILEFEFENFIFYSFLFVYIDLTHKPDPMDKSLQKSTFPSSEHRSSITTKHVGSNLLLLKLKQRQKYAN